jgi:uncharacterized integral membrane protein
MRPALKLLVLAVFAASFCLFYLAWRFARDNSGSVTIVVPGLSDVEVLLWVALLAAFALGAILMGLAAAYRVARLGLLARRYRKIIRGLESEVHQLRNLPLTDDEPASEGSVSEPEPVPAPRRALGRGA